MSTASAVWSGGSTLPAGLQAALNAALSTSLTDSTHSGSGSVGATFSATDKTFDFLAAGETLKVTYNVTVTDSTGASSIQPVTFTVTGTNDAPMLAADAVANHALTEISATTNSASPDSASATLSFTDADLDDTHHVSVSTASAVWSGGSTLPAGLQAALNAALSTSLTDSTHSGSGSVGATFSAADKTFDFLAAGEKLTLAYDVTVKDNNGATSTQTLTFVVTGTNDAPTDHLFGPDRRGDRGRPRPDRDRLGRGDLHRRRPERQPHRLGRLHLHRRGDAVRGHDRWRRQPTPPLRPRRLGRLALLRSTTAPSSSWPPARPCMRPTPSASTTATAGSSPRTWW